MVETDGQAWQRLRCVQKSSSLHWQQIQIRVIYFLSFQMMKHVTWQLYVVLLEKKKKEDEKEKKLLSKSKSTQVKTPTEVSKNSCFLLKSISWHLCQ